LPPGVGDVIEVRPSQRVPQGGELGKGREVAIEVTEEELGDLRVNVALHDASLQDLGSGESLLLVLGSATVSINIEDRDERPMLPHAVANMQGPASIPHFLECLGYGSVLKKSVPDTGNGAHSTSPCSVGIARSHDKVLAMHVAKPFGRALGIGTRNTVLLHQSKPCTPIAQAIFMRMKSSNILGLEKEALVDVPCRLLSLHLHLLDSAVGHSSCIQGHQRRMDVRTGSLRRDAPFDALPRARLMLNTSRPKPFPKLE
jgi:hypothetical protein